LSWSLSATTGLPCGRRWPPKVELEIWGGALLARIQSDKRDLTERIELSEQRLIAELACHAKAFQASTTSMISGVHGAAAASDPER
jgi:hypothetical protein